MDETNLEHETGAEMKSIELLPEVQDSSFNFYDRLILTLFKENYW